jgi:hypothetical protein
MRTTTTVNGLDSRHEIHRMILLVFSVLFLADGYSLFQDYWLSMVARIRNMLLMLVWNYFCWNLDRYWLENVRPIPSADLIRTVSCWHVSTECGGNDLGNTHLFRQLIAGYTKSSYIGSGGCLVSRLLFIQ